MGVEVEKINKVKDKIKLIINKIVSSEKIQEITSLIFISIIIWMNGSKIYGEHITPILMLLVLVGYKFLKLVISVDKRLSLKCWVLSSVIMMFEVYGRTIRPYIYQKTYLGFGGLLNLIILSLLLAIMITPIIFYIAYNIKIDNEIESKGIDKKYLIINWILLAMMYGVCWFGFYPGLLAYSISIEQNIIESNSVLYTVILRSIKLIIGDSRNTIAIFNLIQIGIITFSIALGISYLKKLKVTRLIRNIALSYYIVVPAYALLSVCITKYALLGSIGLINIVLVSEMIRTKDISYTKLIGVALIGSLLDINYLYMLIITSLIVLKLEKNKDIKKLLGSLGIIAIITLGLNGLTNIDNGLSDKMINIPCQQIARTCRYNKIGNLERYQTIDSVLPLENSSEYSVLSVNNIKVKVDRDKLNKNKFKFMKEYLSLGIKYPIEYFEAYFLKNIGLWYSNEKTSYNLDLLDLSYYSLNENDKVGRFINSFYSWFNYDSVGNKIGVFRRLFYIGSYTWITIICLVYMVFVKKREYLVLPIMLLSYLFVISFDSIINIHNTFIVVMSIPYLLSLTCFGMKNRIKSDKN